MGRESAQMLRQYTKATAAERAVQACIRVRESALQQQGDYEGAVRL